LHFGMRELLTLLGFKEENPFFWGNLSRPSGRRSVDIVEKVLIDFFSPSNRFVLMISNPKGRRKK
jgi:hypothetical protein